VTRRERLERKLEKRAEWAEKARARSEARISHARDMASVIPFGQPILVGHHSEKRDRNYRGRIESNFRKGFEELKLSQHHEARADGLEAQLERTVFSDDENAMEALEARIAEREAQRDRKKLINKLYKKGDAAGLQALGLDLEKLRASMEGCYSWEKLPFHAYELTNLGATIRTDKKRIEDIKKRQARQEAAEAAGGVTVEVCGYEGHEGRWCRVTFAKKPERAILDSLKAAGFGWGAGSWSGERAKLPPGILPD
jgi:DNA repair exonuclease SbcCD ATPase subunit